MLMKVVVELIIEVLALCLVTVSVMAFFTASFTACASLLGIGSISAHRILLLLLASLCLMVLACALYWLENQL